MLNFVNSVEVYICNGVILYVIVCQKGRGSLLGHEVGEITASLLCTKRTGTHQMLSTSLQSSSGNSKVNSTS